MLRVKINDNHYIERAKIAAAHANNTDEYREYAASIARNDLVKKLKKTEAFNPDVKRTVIIKSDLPIRY